MNLRLKLLVTMMLLKSRKKAVALFKHSFYPSLFEVAPPSHVCVIAWQMKRESGFE